MNVFFSFLLFRFECGLVVLNIVRILKIRAQKWTVPKSKSVQSNPDYGILFPLQIQFDIKEEVFVFHTQCDHSMHHAEYGTAIHLPCPTLCRRESGTLCYCATFVFCAPHHDLGILASNI